METTLGSDVVLGGKFLLARDQGQSNDQISPYYWDRNRASWCAAKPTIMDY